MKTEVGEIILESIETREITFIKVEALLSTTIWDCAKEALILAKLLKCAVHLHFNDKVLKVYTNSTLEDILKQNSSK